MLDGKLGWWFGLRGTPAAIAETDVMSLFTVGIGVREEEMKHLYLQRNKKLELLNMLAMHLMNNKGI